MNRTGRAAWRTARTLRDLGNLTARWLEGDLADVPGYVGPPAAETLPLVPVLAGLNRAGYVTCQSQPAYAGPGYDGAYWEQRAAVEGFAGTALALRINDAAWAAGLFPIVHAPYRLPRWCARYGRALTVTRRAAEPGTWFGGEPVTSFGAHLPRRHLRDAWTGYGDCHPDAVAAVCEAWQVTVIDPLWGRPGLLWDVLQDLAAQEVK